MTDETGVNNEYTRDGLAWAIQSRMAYFIPDDYEEAWPAKASYALADAIIDGSIYKSAQRLTSRDKP